MKDMMDLEIQRLIIDDRVKVLELDLKGPMEANRNFMTRLLEFEQLNLRKIDVEIYKKKNT